MSDISGAIAAPATAPSTVPVPLADLFQLACEHERDGRIADAERLLAYILQAHPEQADALHLAGVVAYRRGDRPAALSLMQRSLAHGIDTPLYWRNICEVLRSLGQLDDALVAGARAVALNPDDPDTLANLALIHADRRELDAAEAHNRAAIALDPSHARAHFGLAEVLLLRGDFAEGWREYEWRFDIPGAAAVNLPPGPRRMWDGRRLPPGRLLLIADQGFGDVIQFGRFIPWALERCPGAAVACSREMRSILSQYGATRFVGRWEEAPPNDAYMPLSGLPRLFGADLGSIPAAPARIRADPRLAGRWKSRLDQLVAPGLRRIGLVWAGRPAHSNDHRRSVPLSALAPLFDLDHIAWIALQKGEARAQGAGYAGRAPLVNLGPQLGDWDDTMAVLDGLEAVVTVDTAIAHIAGAMGARTNVMLAQPSEWRWLLERSDSPWYPSARLFRQRAPGDWRELAQAVAEALAIGQ